MRAPELKSGPVGDWPALNRLLLPLIRFVRQFHKLFQDTAVRRLTIKIGSFPTATASQLGTSDTSPGDVVRFLKSDTDPDWIILTSHLEITTAVSGITVNIGTAADGNTSSTNLFNAQSVASTGVFQGNAGLRFSSPEYITGTASSDPTGLTGNLYLTYANADI